MDVSGSCALFVSNGGSAADVKVKLRGLAIGSPAESTVTFQGVTSGTTLRVRASKIFQSGTTNGVHIVALYSDEGG